MTKKYHLLKPMLAYNINGKWKYGLTDFYLPYEIGLDNVMEVLEIWKKRYENLMVFDIADIFTKCGFKNIWHNAKLHSLDKKHKHLIWQKAKTKVQRNLTGA